MKKVLITAAMLAVAGAANAVPVQIDMVSFMQQGTSATRWKGCTDYTQFSPCIKPATLTAARVSPSTAVWTWDNDTGILAMTGMFNEMSTISSQAAGPPVIGDHVENMTIDTINKTTTATEYHCIEGTFLATVGANGCLNTSLGDDFTNESSAVYNVGGNADCINRTIGGDDTFLAVEGSNPPVEDGAPRGLTTHAAGGGCDATSGAFIFYHVVSYTGPGGQLVLDDNNDGTVTEPTVVTFNVPAVVPVPGAVWLLGSALGLLGVARRRLAA